MYLFDEKFRLVLNFVDKVIWCIHICLCSAKAHECPLSNTFRHRRLADHENIFRHNLIPHRLLFLQCVGKMVLSFSRER